MTDIVMVLRQVVNSSITKMFKTLTRNRFNITNKLIESMDDRNYIAFDLGYTHITHRSHKLDKS